MGAGLRWTRAFRKSWPGFEVSLQFGAARYDITVENPDSVSRGVASAVFDGVGILGRPLRAALTDDGKTHRLEITLGALSTAGTG